jgi:hypothetical protein
MSEPETKAEGKRSLLDRIKRRPRRKKREKWWRGPNAPPDPPPSVQRHDDLAPPSI